MLSRRRRCMFLGKIQDNRHRRHARHEKRLSVQFVREINRILGQKRVRNMFSPSQWRAKLHAFFGRPLFETTRGPTVHQGNPAAFGSPISAEFLRVTFEASPRRALRCGHVEDFKFHQTFNGCVTCLNTILKENIKKVIRDSRQDSRRG